MQNVILVMVLSLFLGACASQTKNPTADIKPETGVVETLKQPEPESPVDEDSYQYRAKATVDQVEQVPDWYLKTPIDEKMIYSSGTAVSPDIQLSVDIAVLNAKNTLADRIDGKLSSQTKSFIAKVGTEQSDTSVLTELEKVTKNIVSEMDVAGYKISNTKVVASGTQYRAYVLLEYSDKESNKIIMNRLKKNRMLLSKIRSTDAFKELDESIEDSKTDEAETAL